MVSYGCAIAIFLQSCILNGIFTQYFLVFCKLSSFLLCAHSLPGHGAGGCNAVGAEIGWGACSTPQPPAAPMGRAGCSAVGAHPEGRGSPAMCPKTLGKGRMCSGPSHISPENFLLY